MHLGIAQASLALLSVFTVFPLVMVFCCKATGLMAGLVLRARYQAQSHDISTMLEEQKHHQRGFYGFCLKFKDRILVIV